MIVDEHIEFGQEGFQFFGHALILETLRLPGAQRHTFKESIIWEFPKKWWTNGPLRDTVLGYFGLLRVRISKCQPHSASGT